MPESSTNLAIRFSVKPSGNVLATLAGGDATTIALAVERADAHTAASDLVKAYFTLNPFNQHQVPSERRIASHPADIDQMLRDAINNNEVVRLDDYTHVDGTPAASRGFRPFSITDDGRRVYGRDLLRQRNASFVIANIGRLERIDG